MAKLCLGTVQFGMKYGINNRLGQPSLEQSLEMLDIAIGSGINIIDTAKAYGQAEEILGKYFAKRKNSNSVNIISKLRPNLFDQRTIHVKSIVEKELTDSLKIMGIDCLNGYLLHTPEYIYRDDIVDALVDMKRKGFVQNIGISIYEIKEGFAAIETGVMDYIQVPYSVLDQRADKTHFLSKAKESGLKVFTRSAFLQGLFMMEYQNIPSNLSSAIPYIEKFEQLSEKYHIGRTEALIHFVTMNQNIDYLVFGVDTREQLIEDMEIYKNKTIPYPFIDEMRSLIKDVDKGIIFPSLWSNRSVKNTD